MFTVAFIQFYSSLSTRLTGTLDILWLKDFLNFCWIPLNIFISHFTSLVPSGCFSSSKMASCAARTNVASLATGKNASGSSISWLECEYVSRIPASAAFLRFPSEWINVEKLSFGCCNWICTRVLLVVADKLEPAGLKFSKCSDHAEFTRDLFFLL